MTSCRSAFCVLLLLTFTTVKTSVKVKLHHSAILPCSGRCSGVVKWTVFYKRSDTLAECDQTACRSMKKGYQMIHDEYLKGNLSLTITEADFSKKGWYTCECDRKDVCDVRLQIEAVNSTVQKMPGESLVLNLYVSDSVKVFFNSSSSANGSSGRICTVNEQSPQCESQYAKRASVISALELRDLRPSEKGDYTVMDVKTEEVIHISKLDVADMQQSWIWKNGYEKGNCDGYQKGLVIGGVSFGIVTLIIGVILGMFIVTLASKEEIL